MDNTYDNDDFLEDEDNNINRQTFDANDFEMENNIEPQKESFEPVQESFENEKEEEEALSVENNDNVNNYNSVQVEYNNTENSQTVEEYLKELSKDEEENFVEDNSNEPQKNIEETNLHSKAETIEENEQKDELDDFLEDEDNILSSNNKSINDEIENEKNTYDVSDEDGIEGNEQNDNDDYSKEDDYSYTQNAQQEGEDVVYKGKISAEEAENSSKNKPKLLNKKNILAVIVVVFCFIMLFTFLTPTKAEKNKKNKEPKLPEQHSLSDYSAYAKNDPNNEYYPEDKKEEENSNNPKYKKRETQYDENGDVIIPPVVDDKKDKYQYNGNQNTGGGGGGSSLDIPDTRNDSLQSKSIMGIKGITGSQERYSTDYQQTIDKNTNSTNILGGYTLPSKEEYMNSALQAYSTYTNGNNNYASQNDQSGKSDFYNRGRNGTNVGQGQWLDLNTIWQGTIFEATLTSELNTDLPGEITARVTKNIYSSQDGRYLLIPQNSLLYGSYNSSISYSQKRVQVGWHTIVRPDGYSIDIGNMNGTDAKGASGLKGLVNDHPLGYLKAIGLMSVVSIVNSEFQQSMDASQNQYVQNIMANSQEVTNQLGEKLIDRAMNVQPTIKIKAGTKFNIVANRNLSLPPMEEIPVTQKYMRNKR